MILLLNGAFGIGKTTVARALTLRLPRSVVFDPERIGIPLQRAARLAWRQVDDFQELALWRALTVAGLRATRMLWPNVIVPMAFSNVTYLTEIRSKLRRFEPRVLHVCLIAPIATVHARLRSRGADPLSNRWEFRRSAECCQAHEQPAFSTHVSAADRDVESITEEILGLIIQTPLEGQA